ncbi:N-formylglutamate deformylase [Pseudomonas sp. CCM 7891]|uniref:N-formylglutamate deformylase n=1 Tax=Pseudomonas karstica TaxID=1055468 RepID=A0A7X2RTB2_9PSED|nr:N-formylglutamate deformylase [Pseudomonas karstica]MTD20702.1 N-formylglutamate deformylase [Pseudomonas karstica]
MSTDQVFTLHQGSGPLLVSMPHVGTYLPPDIRAKLSPTGLAIDDTDWHIDSLYDFAIGLGASYLQPTCSRYVIDLNRPADGANLYPGQNTTGLFPLTTFDGVPLYLEGCEPDEAEEQRRLHMYWHPYHYALQAELARIKAKHGYALLWEAHSIRSVIPRLFEGSLPVFNFGTADGASCDLGVAQELLKHTQARLPDMPAVLNGRFKGGYITRTYGNPSQHVHAIQLELAQLSYMQEEPPYALDSKRVDRLKPVLSELLEHFIGFKPHDQLAASVRRVEVPAA